MIPQVVVLLWKRSSRSRTLVIIQRKLSRSLRDVRRFYSSFLFSDVLRPILNLVIKFHLSFRKVTMSDCVRYRSFRSTPETPSPLHELQCRGRISAGLFIVFHSCEHFQRLPYLFPRSRQHPPSSPPPLPRRHTRGTIIIV